MLDKTCEYGCGQLANFEFKNKKHCCSSRANLCPAQRKRNMKGTAFDNSDGILCKYGCNNLAKYKFNNGAYCCSEHTNSCPEKTRKGAKSIAEALAKIDPTTGKTIDQLRLQKVYESVQRNKTKIDPATGLTITQLSAVRRNHTINSTILDNGLTIKEDAIQKMSKAKKGNPTSRLGGIKSDITKRKTIDPVTGLTVKEMAIQKTLQAMTEIGSDGLSLRERSLKKSNFKGFKVTQYKHFSIFFQGSHEEKFLDLQYSIYGEDLDKHVVRPKAIWYFDPTRGNNRTYFPDFLVDNKTMYEIKSRWTWDNNTPGSEIETRNKAKLAAAKNLGYDVKLILDFIDTPWE